MIFLLDQFQLLVEIADLLEHVISELDLLLRQLFLLIMKHGDVSKYGCLRLWLVLAFRLDASFSIFSLHSIKKPLGVFQNFTLEGSLLVRVLLDLRLHLEVVIECLLGNNL